MRRDEGFTLVELVVVIAIVGILMTIGIASYRAMNRQAGDRSVQLDLVTAAKVQALHHLEHGFFSDDGGALRVHEPNLQYSAAGDPSGSIVVVIEDGRSAIDVCLFAVTPQGDWFAIRHSATDGDRYALSGPVACEPGTTDAWSASSW